MTLNLLAVTHYPPMAGGSSRSCALLFEAIARRGHQVHVLAAITPEDRGYDDRHQAERPATLAVSRYELPHISLIQFDTSSFLEYQALEHEGIRRELPVLVDRVQPDVIVAAHETIGAPALEVARAKGRPCALLLRGSPTWQIASGRYPPHLTARYLDLYRSVDLVVAVSRYLQTAMAGMGIDRASHIPNLLDLTRFVPAAQPADLRDVLGIPAEAIVVLHPSTMVSRKRPLDILQAAELTVPLASDLFFVFAGGEHRAAELEAQCRRGPAVGRVRFVPAVPYTDMPAFYNLADIVVMASEGEGMSRVYLEAQACGRALVASDIAAACEVIEHGATGILFRTGDAADLADWILMLAGDAALRARLGARARARVHDHAVDLVAGQYVDAFAELLSGSR